MRIKISALILILIVTASTYSQEEKKWDLKDCIQYALEHNLDLKKQNLNVELSALNLKQSKDNRYPNLNFGAGRTWNFGDKFDVYTNTFQQNQSMNDNYNLSSNVVLFSGFQKLLSIRKNKAQLKANQAYSEKSEDDLMMNIATAYLNVLFSKERLASTEMQFDISKMQIDKTKKLVEAGSLPEGNLLDVLSQSSTDELNNISAKNNLDIALLTLSQLLDLPTAKGFDVKTLSFEVNDFPFPDVDERAIINTALSQRPEINAALWDIKSAEENLKIAKAGYYPSLNFNASVSSRYSDSYEIPDMESYQLTGSALSQYVTASGEKIYQPTFTYDTYVKAYDDQLNENFYQYVGLNFSIPIFNNFNVRNRVQSSKIEIERAILSKKQMENSVRKIVQQAYLDAKSALKKYQAATKKETAVQKSFEYTQKKFNLGMLNSVDFQLSKSNLSIAESELIQAKFDYVFKILVLNFYMGKEFRL